MLIADDNEALRRAIKSLLAEDDEGWIIAGEAANGTEAVELAGTSEPDVVLLDFQMPIMNGLDAAKKIVASNPSVPVAMYTLHQSEFFESQAKAAGVWKVIPKADLFSTLPSSLSELVHGPGSTLREARKSRPKQPGRKAPRKPRR
ncbi:MAG: response regulator [Candidatus Acidiferrales bacterium]